MQPPRLDEDQGAPVYGDRLGRVRTCRSGCGRPTRQAHHKTRPEVLVDVDADPAPGPPGDYWHPRIGWRPVVAGHPHDLPVYREHLCTTSTSTEGHHPMFGTPKAGGGDRITNDELNGRPVLLTVHSIERGVVTSAGTTDAIRADVALLDDGAEHSDVLLFGKVLVTQFEAGIQYVGRIGKGVAQPGKSAPWTFTDGPDLYETASKYLAHKAATQPAAPAPAPTAAPAFTPAPVAAPAAAPAPTAVIAPPWAS